MEERKVHKDLYPMSQESKNFTRVHSSNSCQCLEGQIHVTWLLPDEKEAREQEDFAFSDSIEERSKRKGDLDWAWDYPTSSVCLIKYQVAKMN